jgi:hypothetical protein
MHGAGITTKAENMEKTPHKTYFNFRFPLSAFSFLLRDYPLTASNVCASADAGSGDPAYSEFVGRVPSRGGA